ncbi:fluoride efflux transporter family protein [Corynebacterium tapiri]|uniref:Fluoride-specific ion channel FluC n=1 Tax=Corynebacterium tapiri TaxID=1448266 RepID=A0A5C4U1U6_9CORY|nr:fluoride efflux transporter family protein [Corynebacterium tapiri]TNL95620.1 fluoride efflux transporter family protein [Corynebacterium tapiri]
MKDGLVVALGAGLGATARFWLSSLLDAPLSITLAINLVGCFAFGLFRPGPFWGSGVLGGFTTLSTFALLAADLPTGTAIFYVLLTMVGSVAAALLGRRLSA